MSLKLNFSEKMLSQGLRPPRTIVTDGKLHFCELFEDSHDASNGWYIYTSGKLAVGLYGCFEKKLSRVWSSKLHTKLNKEELLDYLTKLADMRKERKKARKQYFGKIMGGEKALSKILQPLPTNGATGYNENEPIENDNSIITNSVTAPICQKKGVTPPDKKGVYGPVRAMILGGLRAFYEQKGHLPEKGKAFPQFLNFINIQFNQKTIPDFLTQVVKIEKSDTIDTAPCITIMVKGVKKKKNRKYIENQFYTFKKEFDPLSTSESPTHP